MQLMKKVEEYRVETEEEAVELINKYKENQTAYEVVKSGYTMKTKKAKGEVIDMWYIVSITLNYNIGE